MIVQRKERSLETSVNKLSFAGFEFTQVRFSSGAFSVFERASTMWSAIKDGREFPCRGSAPAVTRDLFSPAPCPGAGPLRKVQPCHLLPLQVPSYLPALLALLASRATAQTKPASSRATAVRATVLRLPLLSSAR
jgi:hypothetical protein